jgi:phosphoribosylformimino-5-aminoimidazole carboxamide ribotide isomerase
MRIYPAIDIKNGQCVRLFKGDFKKKIIYKIPPDKQAFNFKKIGFKYLHLIDLDGAKDGFSKNKKIIENIVKNIGLKIQLGGGIRNEEQIKFWLSIGVDSVVLGTLALEDIENLKYLCKKFPKKISLALDVKNNFLYSRGWAQRTTYNVFNFLKIIKDFALDKIIYTDINRDGTKRGVNFKKINNFISKTNFPVIISGGISGLNDVLYAKKLKKIYGVIIGKSMYDNSINHTELVNIQ